MPTLIPSRDECLVLMRRVSMQPHIQKHCFMVAEFALYLGHRFNDNGFQLNIQLLEAGALLHDIAKPQSICTGEKHEKLGACMLRQWGYHSVAPIVEDHVSMDHARASGPVTESLLVNYSDKRVKHDEIVTLDERFEDLINRYARTEAHKASLAQKLNLYSMLEARIFSYIDMSPDGVGILGLRLPLHFTPGGESQDYEQEEVICRTAVRREVR